MAKGIRSKNKRKNRSELRKVLSQPIMQKRLELQNEAIKRDLKEKMGGKTILGLKSKLIGKSTDASQKASVATAEDEDDADDDDDDDNNAMAEDQHQPKESISEKLKKKKGSKAKSNPAKELTWF